jgi:hypothetical protein
VCRRVETDYLEAQDEAERRETMTRTLSEGVYAYLKKRGLLAPHQPPVAERDARGATGREAMIPNE